ncbi:MAG: S8 family serine peptidase [Phycisphaerales bacterium]|nr:S8 family serine peptidase [Planctomycetota bacterium]MCH8508152.1 S8 family serine peptidase [Phycisphaerales bacterium]
MKLHTRFSTGLTLSLAVVMASGSPLPPAAQMDGADQVRVATDTQRLSAQRAFAWQARDAGLLDRPLRVTERFVEIPGTQERSGLLVAKVRDRVDMARLSAVELATRPTPIQRGNDGFEVLWDRADARIAEARARLAPSLVEAHLDVDVHSFRVPDGWTEEEAAALLMATGDYEYVEPDWLVSPLLIPNDPQFGQQWHHRAEHINSVRAWDFVTGGPDIIVAVVDTGVRKSHADLGVFVPGFNATTNLREIDGGNTDDAVNGHGTTVAGAMAATGNNGIGVAGVGWNFSIMPIRVSDRSDGNATLSNILQGARWASDSGAFAINASYGGSNASQTNTSGNYIRQRNAVLVFASGNDGVQSQTNDWTNVTVVGASNTQSNVASFSNYGPGIDVVAPGTSIRTTTRSGGYTNATGTSLAAPLAAGAMALIRAADPDLSATQVEQLLKDTATDIGPPGRDIFSGWGIINVGLAVETAILGPSVINLPFFDDFTTGSLSNLWRDPVGSPEVNADAAGLGDGEFALNLGAGDAISTVAFRAAVFGTTTGEISFDVQHRGVPAGQTLLIEGANISGSWQTLSTITSDGTDQDGFRRVRIGAPFFTWHDQFKLRFTASGDGAGQNWYVDNVLVSEFERNIMPWHADFEGGIDTTFDWASAQSVSTTSDAPNIPVGTQTAKMTGAAGLTSQPVDVTATTATPYVRLRTLHNGVDAGGTLKVEYLDIFDAWTELETITSDGVDRLNFTLHQFPLPLFGFGEDLQIRITANGSSSSEIWYVDDVAITEEFLSEPPTCPADLNGDGVLNFFDISTFITLFNAQDPIADWNNDGVFNFFDISEYLAAYNAGCP